MNILLCLDDISGEYSKHVGVTLLSLFETNPKHVFDIYILSSQISEKNQKEIKNIVSKRGSNVFFIIARDLIPTDIKEELIFSRPELTYATFYRLFFCENIDTKKMKRILYLDCDTLIIKDIKTLYEQNMSDSIIVGSRDTRWMEYLKKKTLGLKNYINAGVLLIDVQKYKEVNLTKNIRYINKYYGEKIKNDDQDYINLIFRDSIKLDSTREMNCIIDRKYLIQYKEAAILHLTNKPYLYSMPLPDTIRKLYHYYLQKTNFKNNPTKNTCITIGIAWYSSTRSITILLSGYLFGSFGSYWAWKITNGPIYFYTKILGK